MDAACFTTRHRPGEHLPTHRHIGSYATLVTAGCYVEGSPAGSYECVPGTLIVHPAYHVHADRFGRLGGATVNRDVASVAVAGLAVLRVASLHEARRQFRHAEGLDELIQAAQPVDPLPVPGWQAEFVRRLVETDAPISTLAADVGVSAAHACRSIKRSHGLHPLALRREMRWSRALAALPAACSLAELAAECGFADQSHLCRTFRECSGLSPSQMRALLRAQVKSVQA